jgi:uncharacterized membrane protein YvlD (DUF360 family)
MTASMHDDLVASNPDERRCACWVCDKIGVGLDVDGFLTVLRGAVVISVVSWLVGQALPDNDRPG